MRRRSFLRAGTALALASALPLQLLFSRRAWAGGYGALVPDPGRLLDLPAGFRYQILERRGDRMSDGYRVPGRPDGMACFPGAPGTVVLMRNHENAIDESDEGPYHPGQPPPAEAYDPRAMGGVTRLVVDAERFERISSNLALAGTARNCAGGLSPFGWLTCEESVDPGHGWVFLCRTDAETVQPARRIQGYGRFYHEAAAIEPATRIAYLTEDRADGCLYRFLPAAPADAFTGKLQAMRVVGKRAFATGTMKANERVTIEWVDAPEGDSRADDLRTRAVERGAATVARGEGLWIHEGAVYVAASVGGSRGRGQILRLRPEGDSGSLEVLAESTDKELLDMPDNITVAPWGDVIMAEDNSSGVQHLRGLTPGGEIYDFARNVRSRSELCGVCFSPDARALFVNMQREGLTLAITGPFGERQSGPSPRAPRSAAGCGACDVGRPG